MRLRRNRIAGVDEAGRGPIAGPVVAAAVIFSRTLNDSLIRDSKTLTPRQRSIAYDLIKKNAVAIGIGIVGHKVIDRINIRNATFRAMAMAIRDLKTIPDLVLVDGFEIPDLDLTQRGIIGGDAKEQAISAASIIAKVTRDRMMVRYHHRYPEYGFISNKGYPTKYHIKMLKRFGPSPIHRLTFHPVCNVNKR